MWKCPVTGRLFDSKAKAAGSARRAKAKEDKEKKAKEQKDKLRETREYQSNYVRLNAESVEDIPRLVEEKAKEFWGIDAKVKISKVRRFAKEGDNIILRFRITASIETLSEESKKTLKSFCPLMSFSDSFSVSTSMILFQDGYLGSGFVGIVPGSGCPGRVGEYDMEMDGHIILDNFPLLYKKYEEYLSFKEQIKNHHNRRISIRDLAKIYADQIDEVKTVKDQIAQTEDLLESIKKDLSVLTENYSKISSVYAGEFSEFCLSRMEKCPEIPSHLSTLFKLL